MKISKRLAQAEDALRETREVADEILALGIADRKCSVAAFSVENTTLGHAFEARADAWAAAAIAVEQTIPEREADVAALRRQLGRTP